MTLGRVLESSQLVWGEEKTESGPEAREERPKAHTHTGNPRKEVEMAHQ